MTMYDTIGTQAETAYRQQQITREYRRANGRHSRRNHHAHHQGRFNRWREARQHSAA